MRGGWVHESQQFQVGSGFQAIFAGLHDVEAITRGVNAKSAKLLTLLLELVDVVGIEYKVPVQQSVADSPLFVLIPYLAQAGEEQWRLQMQTQLEKVLHDDPSLVQVAKNCWSATRTATSADDRYEVAIARQMSLGFLLGTALERGAGLRNGSSQGSTCAVSATLFVGWPSDVWQ